MKTTTEKKINLLTGYAIISSLVFGTLILSSFGDKEKKEVFDEITVKRINVVDEKGEIRMVLSNKERQHSGRMNGKDWSKRERMSGMLFFNDEGDECGGLIYSGKTTEGKTNSGMSITMDQYHEDQVIQILNAEYYENGKSNIERGISINDFPVGSNIDERNLKLKELEKIENADERKQKIRAFMKQSSSKKRLFIGRTRGNSSGLFLADTNGQPRMMIYVDDKGNPKIETFNEKGEPINFLEEKK
jgi:hypothetical protein